MFLASCWASFLAALGVPESDDEAIGHPRLVSALVYQHLTHTFQLIPGSPSGLWSIRDRSTAGSPGVFILVGGSGPTRSMVQQLRLRTV